MNPVKKWWNGQSERRRDGLRFVGIAIVLVLTVMVSAGTHRDGVGFRYLIHPQLAA